jgi:hypothetical protein
MRRKSMYMGSLVVFLLMWRMLGFAAAFSRDEPSFSATTFQATSTALQPETGADALIPVTGETPAQKRIPTLAIFLGFTAVLGILVWLNAVNKPATRYIHQDDPPEKP